MVLTKEDFLLHEYDALRSEIVQRTVVRFTILALLMTVFGAVFAFSTTSIAVYLQMLYPVLSGFLLAAYISNSYGIREISKFIKDHIEENVQEKDQKPTISTIGWHHKTPGGRIEILNISLSYLLNNFIFPVSSLIAWGVSWITISDPKFTLLSRNGIDITHLALWSSLVIILISFLFALFEGRIFNPEQQEHPLQTNEGQPVPRGSTSSKASDGSDQQAIQSDEAQTQQK